MKKSPEDSIDDILKHEGYSLPEEMRHALKWAKLKPAGSTLDIATGAGRMAWCLAKVGHQVVTVDNKKASVNKARRVLSKAFPSRFKFIHADASKLPFKDGSFMTVVCSLAFHEMAAPVACLNEMVRVCHPQGGLLVVDFNTSGFKVLEKMHQILHGKSHHLGRLRGPALTKALRNRFLEMRLGKGVLTSWWLARGPIKP